MASIYRHKNGWRAQIYAHGKRASKTFKTQEEAQRWADGMSEELKYSHPSVSVRESLSGWIAVVDDGGRHRRRTFKTQYEAEVWAKSVSEALNHRLQLKNINEHAEKWLPDYVQPSLDADTIAACATLFRLVSGVYFLLRDGEIVYVGESGDIMRRLSDHFKDAEKMFDSYHVLECNEAVRKSLEAQYIAKFLPPLNAAQTVRFGAA